MRPTHVKSFRTMKNRLFLSVFDDEDSSDSDVIRVLADPIGLAYFFRHAESEFCDENISFLLACAVFKRSSLEGSVAARNKHAAKIIRDHCLGDSAKEVCIQGELRERLAGTLARLTEDPRDGSAAPPDLFAGAWTRLKTTVLRDQAPRFLKSAYYNRFAALLSARPTRMACKRLPLPEEGDLAGLGTLRDIGAATISPGDLLQTALVCRDVFMLLLGFCEQRHCDENLLCLRGLRCLEDLILCKNAQDAEEMAWFIFEKFIDPSAATAVSLSPADALAFSLSVPRPEPKMWEGLQHQARQAFSDGGGLVRDFLRWEPLQAYCRRATKAARSRSMSCSGRVSQQRSRCKVLLEVLDGAGGGRGSGGGGGASGGDGNMRSASAAAAAAGGTPGTAAGGVTVNSPSTMLVKVRSPIESKEEAGFDEIEEAV